MNAFDNGNNALVRELIDSYLLQSRYARSVEYIESDDKDDNHYLEAVMNCGGYYATITYQTFHFTEGKLKLTIAFSGCDYRFTIYDIFNLFNINDFGIYEFDSCIEEKRITKSINALTELIEKYSVDIRNANTNSNVSKLMKNRKADMQAMYYDNISKDDYINGEFDYVKRFAKMPKAKAVSNLSSRVDKGDLTIYEKRLLKYLNDGNELDVTASKGLDFKKARLIVYASIIFISAVIGAVGYVAISNIMFGSNVVKVDPNGYFSKGLIPDNLQFVLIGIAALSFGLIRVIGRPVIKLLCSDEEKEIAKTKFNTGIGIGGFINKFVVPPVAIIIAVAMIWSSNATYVGFTENEIIIPREFSESYENLTVFHPRLISTDNGAVYSSNEECIYIIEHSDGFYQTAEMDTGSYEEQKFTNQLLEHNVKIVEVEQIKNIPNYENP